ncbi:LysR family transcriptional regulator [Shewanella sp. YLB-07]|uniref:LysR family transcriptional regulator n=1 Tax=Shewanella sp. YLB-07 TaxID=2601268 RepID=UPI00128C57D0|nr:LysR family transcriptional regulator [Shewanella sp. YLB-07]MPY24470.1 LysR family transcriptional regulator [Shewanella sp. YLB-07]
MVIDIKSIELFVRIASTRAIAKAGKEFGYSATASSQRIQELEKALGTKLLNRTTRTVSLSTDGELFLIHSKKILESIDEAITDLQAAKSTIKGVIRVAASVSFGRKYITPYIAEFLNSYPEVIINLELNDSIFDIVKNGFDLAFRIGELEPSTLMARKIASNTRMLVASPEYLAKYGTPLCSNDLKKHNCIILESNNVWELENPNGIKVETRVKGNFSTNYGEAITQHAINGGGIALKSKWDLFEHLSSNTLVSILNDHTVKPEWNVWAVRPPGRLVSARVRIFTEFIEKKLKLEVEKFVV